MVMDAGGCLVKMILVKIWFSKIGDSGSQIIMVAKGLFGKAVELACASSTE
jgi:hypothetical protein